MNHALLQLIRHKKSYVCLYCVNSIKGSLTQDAQLPPTTEDVQNTSDAQMVGLLLRLMKKYPGASMKTYARLLRYLQLMHISLRKLKE